MRVVTAAPTVGLPAVGLTVPAKLLTSHKGYWLVISALHPRQGAMTIEVTPPRADPDPPRQGLPGLPRSCGRGARRSRGARTTPVPARVSVAWSFPRRAVATGG